MFFIRLTPYCAHFMNPVLVLAYAVSIHIYDDNSTMMMMVAAAAAEMSEEHSFLNGFLSVFYCF